MMLHKDREAFTRALTMGFIVILAVLMCLVATSYVPKKKDPGKHVKLEPPQKAKGGTC